MISDLNLLYCCLNSVLSVLNSGAREKNVMTPLYQAVSYLETPCNICSVFWYLDR